MSIVWIGLYGACGVAVRVAAELIAHLRWVNARRWVVMGLNVAGSAAAAWLITWTAPTNAYAVTGFLGGLTTFSSAMAPPLLSVHQGETSRADVLELVLTPLLSGIAFFVVRSLTH